MSQANFRKTHHRVFDEKYRFPNGNFYSKKGIPIDPKSDEGKMIWEIIQRQRQEAVERAKKKPRT